MKIFITGGTGFIGSHLVKSLLMAGHEILVTGSKAENELQGVTYLDCHLNGIDYNRLDDIEICFHLSANNDTIATDRQEMFRANVDAPKELFGRLLEKKCKRIVYASSASIYGNGPVPLVETNKPDPLSLYAESKLAFDEWVLANNFPAVGLRYTNVYGNFEAHKGRRASMISKMIQSAIRGESFKLFKYGDQQRDWVYVDDVVALNRLMMDSDVVGIVNCGSGQVSTFNQLAQTISGILGVENKIEYIDCHIKFQTNTSVCIEKAINLGYAPAHDVEKGIKKICSNIY